VTAPTSIDIVRKTLSWQTDRAGVDMRWRFGILVLWWAAGGPGEVAAFDRVTLDGAVLCPSLQSAREADKAIQAGDAARLNALDCQAVAGGRTATLVVPPRRATHYQAQLRLHEDATLGWMAGRDLLPVRAALPRERPRAAEDPDMAAVLRQHLIGCSQGRVQTPAAGSPLALVLVLTAGPGSDTAVFVDVTGVLYQEALQTNPALRREAQTVLHAVTVPKCRWLASASVKKAARSRNTGIEVTVPIAAPPAVSDLLDDAVPASHVRISAKRNP
jgi:hypothetical protein